MSFEVTLKFKVEKDSPLFSEEDLKDFFGDGKPATQEQAIIETYLKNDSVACWLDLIDDFDEIELISFKKAIDESAEKSPQILEICSQCAHWNDGYGNDDICGCLGCPQNCDNYTEHIDL